MALGIGSFLPMLGLMLPLALMAIIVPIILITMASIFGLMTASMALFPLMLSGVFGPSALPVEKMIEEMFLEEFIGEDNINRIFETIEEAEEKADINTEQLEEEEEESAQASVPRRY